MTQAILIVGPNGVGKTKFAFDLARQQNGEVINLDRTYLYKHFPITTGLNDTILETDVEKHLYEVLEPEEESYPAEEYIQLVLQKIEEISAKGKLPIVEGASTVYAPALLEKNAHERIFKHVLGFRFGTSFDIAAKYTHRINQAFNDGLTTELTANRTKYRNSFLIKECHFSVPTIKYLDGEMSLETAKQEILERCLDYKDRQMEIFSFFSNIEWTTVC